MSYRYTAWFVGLLVAGFLGLVVSPAAAALEDKAPDFTLRTLDGDLIRMEELTDDRRVVLINFWATWCGPCQVEMPHLQRLHETYVDQGLTVLSISVDDAKSASKVKPLIKRNGYTFPVGIDKDGKIVTLYNPGKTVPYTVLVNRDGAIASVHSGYHPGDEETLEAEIKLLLTPTE